MKYYIAMKMNTTATCNETANSYKIERKYII